MYSRSGEQTAGHKEKQSSELTVSSARNPAYQTKKSGNVNSTFKVEFLKWHYKSTQQTYFSEQMAVYPEILCCFLFIEFNSLVFAIFDAIFRDPFSAS